MVGLALVVLSLKGFLIPNNFIDGGIIGISLLAYKLLGFNLSLCLIFGNLGFIILAWRKISRTVAIKSSIAILILAASLELIHVAPITTDAVLIALFGGAILGTGIGIIMRSGGAVDGTEVLISLARKRIGLSMSELIMILNSFIFLLAAFKLGIDKAMFSIITYYAATRMIDYVTYGVEHYTALTVISSESEKIKDTILSDFGKAVTVYKGERGFLPGGTYTKVDCDVIVTVITRLELLHIKKAVTNIDPNAFMFVQTINEASGGVLKRIVDH